MVTGLNGATAISVSQTSACALLASGTVQCWGEGGLLGDGTTVGPETCSGFACATTPVPVDW
jgi:hypothetical protein